ncbi:CopD family protein [Solitalea lacus]|uniref:CopD family protein n=1 Tax=Solitalea lacus TaxID=2911172 RepID=UPI001EDB392F|nr:CopD family protein [Solitalea lacus]UKJ06904.1 CopD family protein [Solitalea lacus]
MYLYIKAVHIIFVVSWFAGLFYMVRLFIYHTEANERAETERKVLQAQFEVMESKLWNIITTPSMILTVCAGLWLMIEYQWYNHPWMIVKLVFVAGLLWYHFKCQAIMKQLRQGIFKWTSTQLRVWNEVATIFLFAIVFLVVLKNAVSWLWGFAGLILFSIIIMMAVKIYKRYRTK